jgi:hypothetical protein
MDGVLTDTSGITTNKFYVYTDERNPRYSICCFRLGSQVKLSLPNELLNLFGGNPEENIYAVDHIICLRFEIKQPILKQLTLSKVCKSSLGRDSFTRLPSLKQQIEYRGFLSSVYT